MTSRCTPWHCIWCSKEIDFEACVHEQGTVYCSECGGEVGAEELLISTVTQQAA